MGHLIEPHHYVDGPGKKGRKAKPVETMLRMYLLQVWFSLSDEGAEDAIYDSYAMRRFMGLDFGVEQVPDATTLLHFRHLMEKHDLGATLLEAQNEVFEEQGWIMRGGSIVDATIIAAPSSTKNAAGARDPQMHQTKKGNQWYFAMKAHIGVDAGTALERTAAKRTTASGEPLPELDGVETPYVSWPDAVGVSCVAEGNFDYLAVALTDPDDDRPLGTLHYESGAELGFAPGRHEGRARRSGRACDPARLGLRH